MTGLYPDISYALSCRKDCEYMAI